MQETVRPGSSGLNGSAGDAENDHDDVDAADDATFDLIASQVRKIPSTARPAAKDRARASLPRGRGTGAQFRVGSQIIDQTNWAAGCTRHASFKSLARDTGLSERTVARAVKGLSASRRVLKKRELAVVGDFEQNRYVVPGMVTDTLSVGTDRDVSTPADVDGSTGTATCVRGGADVDGSLTIEGTIEETIEEDPLPLTPSGNQQRERGLSKIKDGWIDTLQADGTNTRVVEHLIIPLIASLRVESTEPVDLLRDIRDQRLIATMPDASLKLLAVRLKETRKVLCSTKDVVDAAPAVLAMATKTRIWPESPSWQAWLDHYTVDGNRAVAAFYERQGYIEAYSEWPPSAGFAVTP